MSRLALLVLLLTISCKTASAPERPNMPGANGLDGRNGKDGTAGRSCSASSENGRASIYCEGQATAIYLPKGERGAEGTAGISCTIPEVGEAYFVMRCPDTTLESGFRDVKVENGKMGESGQPCVYVTAVQGGQEVRCGDQYFVLDNGPKGEQGDQGTRGEKGDTGKNGRDGITWSTKLSRVRSVQAGSISSDASLFYCAAAFETTDTNFAKRALEVSVTEDDEPFFNKVGPAKIFVKGPPGNLVWTFPLNRVKSVKAGKSYKCHFTIFADFYSTKENPVAFTSTEISNPVTVTPSDNVLLRAQDLNLVDSTITFKKTTFNTYQGKLSMKSTETKVSPSTRCTISLQDGDRPLDFTLTKEGDVFVAALDISHFTAGAQSVGFGCNGDEVLKNSSKLDLTFSL